MNFEVTSAANIKAREVSLRCPCCKRHAVFVQLETSSHDTQLGPKRVAGLRRCPNPSCRCLVFVVYEPNVRDVDLLVSYPPERLDFDPSGIPTNIVAAFEEALTCHANGAYTAAAIMVRKALEELCASQGATGNDLFARLTSLSSKIVVPRALLDAAQELRLLGNDAAHVEAQAFNQVAAVEVEAGIELTQELLKAVYQMDDLLVRLRALKKT